MRTLRVFGCRGGDEPGQVRCPFSDGEWMVCGFPAESSNRDIHEHQYGFDADGNAVAPAPKWCPIASPVAVSLLGGES